ncbi:alpha/beta hydrolase [Spirochaeta africana]|nr:alpha/beta hydrolase [Spirochaeta africana]
MMILFGCASSPSGPEVPPPRFTREDFLPLSQHAPAFPTTANELDAELFLAYREFYGLAPGGSTHRVGWIPATQQQLFLQQWMPCAPAGPDSAGHPVPAILILHGYLEHAGPMAPLINHLLGAGWPVASLDLPGHGLSGGERGWIGDFAEYADALEAAVAALQLPPEQPLVLIGHSTGASAIIEYLYRDNGAVDLAILLAPLVRSSQWNLSRVGMTLSGPLPLRRIAGSPQSGTENPYYLQLAELDPLRSQHVNLEWVRALLRWDERNRGYPPLEVPALVIQACKDRVLDNAYNDSYLRERLPQARFRRIRRAHHNLHHEQGVNLRLLLQAVEAAITATTGAVACED